MEVILEGRGSKGDCFNANTFILCKKFLMAKRNAKNVVLPHSQAKLDLYKSYLEKYLPILTLAKGISKINVYDIFCGSGIYEDGNIGSPLIAVECVRKTNELMDQNKWAKKPVTLSINDGERGKIDNVKNLFKDVEIENLSLAFFNLDADEMLDNVISEVNDFSNKERNLVFVDPYGYSKVDKEKILRLLKNGHTEIVLFLPVMHMYRFSEIAILDQERKCYDDLRKFINDFLPNQSFGSVFDFINAITKAISFEANYFSCSHYIERGKGNYYAVFFITSHIYGLERMLEVKWKADPSKGKGFMKEDWGLFEDQRVEYNKAIQLEFLKGLIVQGMRKSNIGVSNIDLYRLALTNEFLPKHVNQVLKEMKKEKRLVTTDRNGILKDFGNATYIDFEYFRKNDVIIFFKLK